jgi:hypothetical protein
VKHSRKLADLDMEVILPREVTPPQGWTKGQLLNVRNAGSHYNVTVYPEEYDPRYPQRTLQFTNQAECQSFVSKWYTPESANPLAR